MGKGGYLLIAWIAALAPLLIGVALAYGAALFAVSQIIALDCHDHGNERNSALSSTSSYCSDTYYKGKST